MDQPYGRPNAHAWNAIKIDGRWRLVDVTWGAGGVKRVASGPGHPFGTFERRFDPFYFSTPPERMIYDHWPSDPRWQLLDPPMSEEAQRALPLLKSCAWTFGLQADALAPVVLRRNEGIVRFRVPPSVSMAVALTAPSGADERPGTALLSRRGALCEVHYSAPGAGRYVLLVYLGGPQDHTLSTALACAVEASGPGTPLADAPGASFERGLYLDSPLQRRISGPQRFRVEVPDATRLTVKSGGREIELARRGQIFEGEVTVDGSEVDLIAEYGSRGLLTIARWNL
jgi:hypothetical protein